MEAKNLRYIVFLIDARMPKYFSNGAINCQDGAIFNNIEDAKEYALDSIDQNSCEKFIIGEFLINTQSQFIGIQNIESFGFKHDKKKPNQLELFS